MVLPKLSTTDTPENKGNLRFPGDAENRCWITHTPENHLDFLTLCWALEVAQGSESLSDHSLVSLPWELPNPTIHEGRRGGREAQISGIQLSLSSASMDCPPARAREHSSGLQRWENKSLPQDKPPSQKCCTMGSNTKVLFSARIPMGRITCFVLPKDTEVTRNRTLPMGKSQPCTNPGEAVVCKGLIPTLLSGTRLRNSL